VTTQRTPQYRPTPEQSSALDAYVKLSRAAAAVQSAIHRHLHDADLTIAQFGVLEALLHLGPMSQGTLARKILTSPGNLTNVVDKLQGRGLIRRERDATDRRVVLVHLTDRGRTSIEELMPSHVRQVTDAFAPLDPNERHHLAALCRTLGRAQEKP